VKRVRKERPSHRIIIMTHHALTMRWSAQNNRHIASPNNVELKEISIVQSKAGRKNV
jgi:hypothetical protein